MNRCTPLHTFPDFVNNVCWIQTVAFVTMKMAQPYQTLPVSLLIQPTQSKQQVAGLFLSLKSLILTVFIFPCSLICLVHLIYLCFTQVLQSYPRKPKSIVGL